MRKVVMKSTTLFFSMFISSCLLKFSYETGNFKDNSCDRIVTCSDTIKNSFKREICKYHADRIGVHNVFSSFAMTVNSSRKFIVLRSSSLEELDKDIEMKELTYLRRMFNSVTGGFLQTSNGYTNITVIESSPFSPFFFTFLWQDEHHNEKNDLICHQTIFDKKLVTFFAFGLLLFFFAENLSRNAVFFYASGMTLGLLMSWMIILIIILKLLPYKKSLFVVVAAGGTSIGLYITQSIIMNLRFYAEYHAYWLILYMGVICLLVFATLYYKGPPKNIRTLNLLKWSLQLLGALFMFNSTWAREVAVTIVVVTFTFYIAIQYADVTGLGKSFLWYCLPYQLRYKLKPIKQRLLTQEEYEEEVQRETKKALSDLRGYCSSPDCDSWKLISKLKDPKRFANFIKTGNIFEEREIKAHEDFEPEEDIESWLSSDEELLPESTQNEELENIVQISEESFDGD